MHEIEERGGGGAGGRVARAARRMLGRGFMVVLSVGGSVAGAAGQQMRMERAEGSVLVMPGGRLAVVVPDSAGLSVRGVVEGDASVPGAKVDIEEGDRIVSLQRVRMADMTRFMAAWDSIPEGTDVALGILRDGREHVVRFPRPPQATGERHIAVAGAGGGAGAWTSAAPGAGGSTEVVIAGAHIRSNGQGMPEVVFRGSDAAAAAVPLRVGDVIVAVNGRSIAALAGLELLYGPLATGADVTLKVRRGDADEVVRFAKPGAR